MKYVMKSVERYNKIRSFVLFQDRSTGIIENERRQASKYRFFGLSIDLQLEFHSLCAMSFYLRNATTKKICWVVVRSVGSYDIFFECRFLQKYRFRVHEFKKGLVT